jgi:hypothetical protein
VIPGVYVGSRWPQIELLILAALIASRKEQS